MIYRFTVYHLWVERNYPEELRLLRTESSQCLLRVDGNEINDDIGRRGKRERYHRPEVLPPWECGLSLDWTYWLCHTVLTVTHCRFWPRLFGNVEGGRCVCVGELREWNSFDPWYGGTVRLLWVRHVLLRVHLSLILGTVRWMLLKGRYTHLGIGVNSKVYYRRGR